MYLFLAVITWNTWTFFFHSLRYFERVEMLTGEQSQAHAEVFVALLHVLE